MEYVNLQTGFALMGFSDYPEYKRVKQLCQEKNKAMAYYGEFSKMKELQARYWAKRVTRGGYMDYHYPVSEYEYYDGSAVKRIGVATGLNSLATAVKVLEEKQRYQVKYVIVARM